MAALGDALHGLEVGLGQVGHQEVGLDAAGRRALGQDGVAPLQAPAQQDLGERVPAAVGDLVEGHVGADLLARVGDLVLGAQGRVRLGQDAVLQAELDEVVVGEEGVDLDLVDGGLDLGEGEELLQAFDGPVGDTDSLDLARLVELLDDAPRGLWVLGELLVDDVLAISADLGLVVVSPLGSDGPVDEVQVDVVETELAQGLVEGMSDVLGLVHVVPELGANEEVLALQGGILLEVVADGITDLLLVLVEGSAVQVPVADLEGLPDGLVALALGALVGEGAEAQAGHLDAVVQGEGELRHVVLIWLCTGRFASNKRGLLCVMVFSMEGEYELCVVQMRWRWGKQQQQLTLIEVFLCRAVDQRLKKSVSQDSGEMIVRLIAHSRSLFLGSPTR